jgi:hypothetical protein
MNSVVQTDSSELPVVTAITNRTNADGTFRCSLSIPSTVADHGRIILGGGFRLPTHRKTT